MEQIEKTYSNRKPLHIVPEIIPLEDESAVTTQDTNVLGNMITTYKQKIEDLIAEIYELSIEKQRDHSEQQMILHKMKDDHARFIVETEKYKKEIADLQQQFKNDCERIEEEKEREKRNLEGQRITQLQEVQKTYKELNEKYQLERKYEDIEANYNQTIKSLTQTYNNSQYRHHDAMNYEQKKQIKQNENVKSRNQLNTKEVLKTAHFQASNNVKQEQKLAYERNMELKEKLLIYSKDLEKLKKQRQSVTKKNKEIKLNASINQESLEQYKAVGALQIAKIKSYKQKVDYMKNFIAQELVKKTKEIKAIKEAGENTLKQLQEELDKVNTKKNIKNKELSNMKMLAETIIMQRVQVQEFFLSSMEYISVQLKQKKRSEPSSNQESKIYNEKIDIGELDLSDKEKILRTLFTRMSTGSKKELT